jgi:tetratricopeptide (TPR) repeat protein
MVTPQLPQAPQITDLIALSIRLVNANQPARARIVCDQALAMFEPHPAVHQLLAVLDLQDGHVAAAREHAVRSLTLRPDHVPTLLVMGDIALAQHDLRAASQSFERAVVLAPDQPEAWFKAALVRQDLHDLDGAITALERVLAASPERVDALVNYGIVLQERGRLDDALRAYGRAFRLREQTFGRIAHALSTPGTGRLWLDLDDLRDLLRALPA